MSFLFAFQLQFSLIEASGAESFGVNSSVKRKLYIVCLRYNETNYYYLFFQIELPFFLER